MAVFTGHGVVTNGLVCESAIIDNIIRNLKCYNKTRTVSYAQRINELALLSVKHIY